MKVKCKCCGKMIDKNDGIRVPIRMVYDDKMEFNAYYCSARCFGMDLLVSSECAVAKLDLTDEQIDKIADILINEYRRK